MIPAKTVTILVVGLVVSHPITVIKMVIVFHYRILKVALMFLAPQIIYVDHPMGHAFLFDLKLSKVIFKLKVTRFW